MKDMDDNLGKEVRIWQEKLFDRSLRRRAKIDRTARLLGSTRNMQCLEISAGDGMLSIRLRAQGGSWKTAVATKVAAESVASSLSEAITIIDNGRLPFPDHAFDRLVIMDALKGFAEDYEFVRECHRVLKNDGWVVISETRRIPFSLVALMQRMLNVSPVSQGKRRNGYTVNELFQILKDGFDVPETIVYSNGLLETVATLGEGIQHMVTHGPYWLIGEKIAQGDLYGYRRLSSLAGFIYPLLWLLSKIELLPGHRLLVKSRRRHWRPRLQPKLIDGRSIAEAAINTKIGTAAPF
jgi:SAM-dependent methyltransferase